MARKKKNDPVITINDNTKAYKTKAEVKTQPVKRDEITIKPVNTQNKNVTSNDVKPVQKQSVMGAVNQKHADPMRAEKVKQKANYNKAKNGSNQKKINEDFKQIDKLYEDTRTTRSGETSTHRKTALSKDETAQRNAIRADIAQKYGLTEKEVDKLYNNYTKQETVKRKAENAKDHKIAATVGAIGDNLIASTMAVPHLVSDLINYNKGENVTSDDASHYFTNSRNATRQAVRDDIKTDFGKKAYDVTNMVGDIGANIGAGILTGGGSVVPSLLSGGQEAERSMVQSLDRGADVDDAFNAAITRGATQALMNKVGFKDRPVNGLGSAALNVLGNAGTEGLANIAQEMISNKTDDFFLGEDADLNTVFNQSMAETKYTGMPAAQRIAIAEEAVRDYKNQQYKNAGLQGALFGGLMSLGNNIPRLRNPEPVLPDAEPTKPVTEPETRIRPDEELTPQQRDIINRLNEINSGEVPQMRTMPDEDLTQIQRDRINRLNEINSGEAETPKTSAEDLAERYANLYNNVDDYDYMDNVENIEGFIQTMSEDIANGRDLTGYIDALEDYIDDAPDAETKSNMQNMIDELKGIQSGRANNNVPQMNDEQTSIGDYFDENGNPKNEAPINPNGDDGGNVPPENPNLVNDEGNGTDISRRYETLKKDPMIEASMLEKAREDGVFNKEIENRKQSQDDALREYVGNEEKVTQSNMEKKWDSGKDVDTSMLIAHDAIAEGNQAKANLAFLKQAIEGRRSGRILRAMRDYAFTKEGALAQATNYMADRAEEVLRSSKKLKADIESIAKEIVDNKSSLFNLDLQFFANTINPKLKQKIGVDIDPYGQQKILDALANGATQDEITNMIAMYKAVGKMGVSDASYDQLEDIWKQMQGMGVKSKSRADLVAKAYAVLADDIGGDRTWKEKWDSWRYLAMLGNPLTHIRNRVGNFSHYLTTEISDNLAAKMEDVYARNHQMERTRSALDNNDSKLVDATTKDADEVYIDLNDTGHKYNVKSEIGRARKAFSTKNRAGQTLNKANDYNSSKLEGADYDALKRKYGKSLARFLKANGADESIFNATDQTSLDLLERGREFAIKQAKDATFHSYSQLANILTNASNSLAKGNVGEKGLSLAMEGVLPFKKTPINILKEGIKYSPVSIAKGLKKMAFDVKKGNATPTEIIGDISAGLTGTGIMALGAFLRANGWLNSRENEDYDVSNAQAEQGEQGYAFRIPEELGGGSYTLDWLAPFSLPLFVGATIVDLFDKKEADNEDMDALDVADNVIDALATIGEPITEMSMLNGINDALKQVAYSKTGAIGTLASNALTGYFTQGVPTLAGQIARSIDPYRRDTYVEKSGAVSKPLEKQLLKAVNKVPALNPISNLITGEDVTQPYIDYKGNLQNNGGIFSAMSEGLGLGNNVVSRFLDNTLSPGYYKKGNVTETDAELNRLYESTGKDIYPYVTSGKVGDEKLSREDKRRYQELFGGTTSELYDSVIKTDDFSSLDDSQKVKLFTDLRDVAKNLADSEIGGKTLNKSDQKLVDMYTSEGKDAVIEYLTNKQILKDLGVRNTEKNQQALEEGGQEFIEQKSAEQQLKEEYGVSGKNALEAYNMGVSGEELQQLSTMTLSGEKKGDYVDYATLHKAIPKVVTTPEDYAKLYDTINSFADTKNVGQKDLLAFFNAVDPDYWEVLRDLYFKSNSNPPKQLIRNIDGTYEIVG